MEDTKISTVDVDAALMERLERLADEQNRPAEVLFVEALNAYLTREEDTAYERRELLARSAEFDQNGLHLTHEEVKAWIRRRAVGDKAPLPPCHT